MEENNGTQTSSSPSHILDFTSTFSQKFNQINESIINKPTYVGFLNERTHVRSDRKLQAPTRLLETIDNKKTSKPPKKKPHSKAFVAQHTH
jgi:hypothetical protein